MKIRELTGKQLKEICKNNKECITCPLQRNGYICHLRLLSIYLDDSKYYKKMSEQAEKKGDDNEYEYMNEQYLKTEEKIKKIGDIDLT